MIGKVRTKVDEGLMAKAIQEAISTKNIMGTAKKYGVSYPTLYLRYRKAHDEYTPNKKNKGRRKLYDDETLSNAINDIIDGKPIGTVAQFYGINASTLRTYFSLYKNKEKPKKELIKIEKRIKHKQPITFLKIIYERELTDVQDDYQDVFVHSFLGVYKSNKVYIDLQEFHKRMGKEFTINLIKALDIPIDEKGKEIPQINTDRYISSNREIEGKYYDIDNIVMKIKGIKYEPSKTIIMVGFYFSLMELSNLLKEKAIVIKSLPVKDKYSIFDLSKHIANKKTS